MGALKLTYYNEQEALKKTDFVFGEALAKRYPASKKGKDCFTFGMVMPGRSYVGSDGYRYGFSGFEADDEIKGEGNSYTTEFRQYDPRVGRWLSIDPVVHAGMSPYNAFDNNPIFFSDPSGADATGNDDPPRMGYLTPSQKAITLPGEATDIKLDDSGKLIGFTIGENIYNAKFSETGGYFHGYQTDPDKVGVLNSYYGDEYTPDGDGKIGKSYDQAITWTIGLTAEGALVKTVETISTRVATGIATTAGGIGAIAGVSTTAAVGIIALPFIVSGDTRTKPINYAGGPVPFYYVTYTKTSADGKVYVGRSSGYGSPQAVVQSRDIGHKMTGQGYGEAVLSTWAQATIPGGYVTRAVDPAYWAIRGSEQLQIEAWRAAGLSGNSINGISPTNPKLQKYLDAARQLFGN